MKLKSLLFGSAAALTVATGAQTGARAADLDVVPVAEPVEYVRICDAAGAGYFFIPGSDTCLKIGGYVRFEAHFVQGYDNTNFVTFEPSDTLAFNHFTTRTRGNVNFSTYTATDIGVIETYIALQGNYGPADEGGYTSAPAVVDAAWARIVNDWGTIQFGKTDSYFDFFAGYWMGFRDLNDDPTTGTNLFAVTANFGNGFSASVSVEDPLSSGRAAQLVAADEFFVFAADTSGDEETDTFVSVPVGGTPTGLSGAFAAGQDWPDVVGRLRVDQAWGAAQVMGVIHQVESAIPDTVARIDLGPRTTPLRFGVRHGLPNLGGRLLGGETIERTRVVFVNGRPVFGGSQEDDIGWAVGSGLQVKIPGTAFEASIQGTYGRGAIGYVTTGNGGPRADGIVRFRVVEGELANGRAVRTIVPIDEIHLSESWSVRAGLQAGLTESLRASITGSYAEVDLDGDADQREPGRLRNGAVFTPDVPQGDYQTWALAGRIDYTIVAGLTASAEVGYEHIELDEDDDIRRANRRAGADRLGDDQFEDDRWGGGIRLERAF